jgi:pimeloyl-ACP methyl ester carboxylesterase
MTDVLQPLKTARAGVLEVAYHEAGPADGEAVLLLHGFPYDIHSYVDVVPPLADAGLRVIVPYLRGHGPTRFVDASTPRSGQQAALGADVVELMDVLDIPRALLAGYDWGGRAACIVAALWPERCAGLVSVNGYLIQDIAAATTPLRPDLEAGFWYFSYFATERGRRGLTENRRDIARVIWTRNSPKWHFDDATLDRAAEAFENNDYVEVVIHSYRHRLGLALRAGISTFELSRYMGASLTMIDRHYGHLARDGREHAIRLLDDLNAPAVDVRGRPVDAEARARRRTRQRNRALSRQ